MPLKWIYSFYQLVDLLMLLSKFCFKVVPIFAPCASVIVYVGVRIDSGVAGFLVIFTFRNFFNLSVGGVLIWVWMVVFFLLMHFWWHTFLCVWRTFSWCLVSFCTTVITEFFLELLTRPPFTNHARKKVFKCCYRIQKFNLCTVLASTIGR